MKKHYSLFCAATLISFLSFSQFEQRPFTFSDASVLNYPEVKPIATSIGFQKSILWTETFARIGMYYVQIISETGSATKKFMKQ